MSLPWLGVLLGAGAVAGPGPGASCGGLASMAASTAKAGEVLSYPPCVEVTLSAEVTGRPPLDEVWTVAGGPVLSGNPVVLDTGLLSDGLHEVVLDVSNSAGSVQWPLLVVVESLGFLGPPELVPIDGATVQVLANTSGATEWRWSWGDGTVTGWLSGCAGSSPVHTFPGPGSYPVTVEARSCRGGPVSWSGVLEVAAVAAPVVGRFEAVCATAPFCSFGVGEAVPFAVEVSGAVETLAYDWDGNGVDDEVAGVALSGHSYASPGFYVARLTVTGPGGSAVAFLAAPVEVVGGTGVLFADGFESGDLRYWTVP